MNQEFVIESFISFCDDMMIAEEGFLSRLKERFTKKNKNGLKNNSAEPEISNVKVDDPKERERILKNIEKIIKIAIKPHKINNFESNLSYVYKTEEEFMADWKKLKFEKIINICVLDDNDGEYTEFINKDRTSKTILYLDADEFNTQLSKYDDEGWEPSSDFMDIILGEIGYLIDKKYPEITLDYNGYKHSYSMSVQF